MSYRQRALKQIDFSPAQRADLVLSERRIQRERYDSAEQQI